MTWPMIVLAIGSVGAGAFLIINDRLQDFLAPVVGVPPESHGFVTVTGVVALVLVLAGVALAWAMYGRVPVPSVAPRGRLLTVAARKDLYGDAFNESVLMRPGQWLTRLSVYFDNRGVDGLVNTLAATVGGVLRPAPQAADRLRPLVRSVHVPRRRGAGRPAAGGEGLMNGFPWLTVAGAVPLLGALVIALIPGLPADSAEADRSARGLLAKQLALAFSLLTLVVVIIIAVKFQVGGPNYQFTEIYSWIPAFGVHYALGVDGIALVLIAMSAVLMPVVILASWNDAESGRHSVKTYFALMLVLETMMIGVFAATDVFLFYVFFEAMLVPMYFMIGSYGVRGGSTRRSSSCSTACSAGCSCWSRSSRCTSTPRTAPRPGITGPSCSAS